MQDKCHREVRDDKFERKIGLQITKTSFTKNFNLFERNVYKVGSGRWPNSSTGDANKSDQTRQTAPVDMAQNNETSKTKENKHTHTQQISKENYENCRKIKNLQKIPRAWQNEREAANNETEIQNEAMRQAGNPPLNKG